MNVIKKKKIKGGLNINKKNNINTNLISKISILILFVILFLYYCFKK